MTDRPRFSVLGPLRVQTSAGDLPLGPYKQQIVLATLLCSPNRHVPIDVLAEAVWGNRPPRTARKNLHVYVSAIRRQLRLAGVDERIAHRNQGYVIVLEPGELDSLAFEEDSRSGASLGTADRGRAAVAVLRRALDRWRGPAFEGLSTVPVIDAEAQRLTRAYVTAFEGWAEAALRSSPAVVIDQIEPVIRTDPFRERLRMIQMIALQREGRQSEALAVFGDYRQALAREFGLQPGTAMLRLHDSLLHDPPAPPVAPGGPCSLPRDITGLCGRGAEVDLLVRALRERDEKLTIVTGPIGTGKTTVAVRGAHDVRDAFADGQFFVTGRGPRGEPRSLGGLLRDLLRDAGVFASGEPTARLHSTWHSWQLRRRVLVVIDDAPDEATVRALIPQVGGSALLVTSRARLSGLAQAERLSLGPLPLTDAVAMLARHIGPDRVDADRAAAERIVLATGLLPMGIAVAGGKLAGLRHLPLREFADRIDASTLDELAVGPLAVGARLETALRDLSASARERFVALGRLSRPTFTLGEACTALGTQSRSTSIELEQLIEANLVVAPDTEVCAHEVVYQLPDLLFHHAVELATHRASRLATVH